MNRLDVELPAAALQDRNANVARLIDLARNRGARIVIREFGSTSLSVGELLRSSIDVVKPDPHLLLSDLKAPRQAAALAAVIELGKAAGAIIQAEGVETAEQRDWLLQHGCELMQGPFFSTALAAEEFPDFCLHYRP
jgi:EAL domain-containing protein (putative c-di-GMP-specific phosphodiesterase class I)